MRNYNLGHFVQKPTGQWDQCRVVSTESITLYTWLLKSFPAKAILPWTFTWSTNTFTCFACSESSIHILLPQISWLPVFQACSFQTPHNAAKLLAKTHESDYNNTPGHFFSEKQCSECCTLGRFPCTTVAQGCPRENYSYLLFAGPACHKEPSINQAWVFSSWVN